MRKTILLLFTLTTLVRCTKDPLLPEPTLPVVSTVIVTNAVSSMAKSGGRVTSSGGAMILARGVCWSTALNPTVSNNKTTEQGGEGAFTSTIINLTAGTFYYVRAYVTNRAGTAYGQNIQFKAN